MAFHRACVQCIQKRHQIHAYYAERCDRALDCRYFSQFVCLCIFIHLFRTDAVVGMRCLSHPLGPVVCFCQWMSPRWICAALYSNCIGVDCISCSFISGTHKWCQKVELTHLLSANEAWHNQNIRKCPDNSKKGERNDHFNQNPQRSLVCALEQLEFVYLFVKQFIVMPFFWLCVRLSSRRFYVFVCLLELLEIALKREKERKRAREAERASVGVFEMAICAVASICSRIIPAFFRFVAFPYPWIIHICWQTSVYQSHSIQVTSLSLLLTNVLLLSPSFSLRWICIFVAQYVCVCVCVCVQYDFIPKQKCQNPSPKEHEKQFKPKRTIIGFMRLLCTNHSASAWSHLESS